MSNLEEDKKKILDNLFIDAPNSNIKTSDGLKINELDLRKAPEADHYRNYDTNLTRSEPSIQSGWTYVVGGGAAYKAGSVLFPDEFDDDDVDINITILGIVAGASASSRQSFTSNAAYIVELRGSTISKTGFTFYIWNRDNAGTVANNTSIGVSWIAVGKKARS